jgi:hypothetical protein
LAIAIGKTKKEKGIDEEEGNGFHDKIFKTES